MRKPTILFMNRVYPPVRGATGRVLNDLAMSFVRKGWHVTVVTSGPIAEDAFHEGVRVIRVRGRERLRSSLGHFWIALKMFLAALMVPRRDVVVSMTDPPLFVVFGRIVAWLKKSRHVHWCHDVFPDVMPALGMRMPGFLMGLFRWIRHGAMAKCDKVIVCGRCMAAHLEDEGLDPSKIEIVPNWPDVELIDVTLGDGANNFAKEEESGVARPFEEQIKGENRFRVLYAGNLGLAHPTEIIIEAAQHFHEAKSDIEFVFVGDGARFDELAARRDAMGLQNIRLLPFQPSSRLREVLESGDVHLVTMKEEACGFVVPCKLYSALAVARPTVFVGPVESEVAKVIHENEAGFIVASDDAENLIKAVTYFREDAEGWFTAHKGAQVARGIYTPHKSMERWYEVVQGVLRHDGTAREAADSGQVSAESSPVL